MTMESIGGVRLVFTGGQRFTMDQVAIFDAETEEKIDDALEMTVHFGTEKGWTGIPTVTLRRCVGIQGGAGIVSLDKDGKLNSEVFHYDLTSVNYEHDDSPERENQ